MSELLLNAVHTLLGIDDLTRVFEENVPAGVEFEKRDWQLPVDDLVAKFRREAVCHFAAYAADGNAKLACQYHILGFGGPE